MGTVVFFGYDYATVRPDSQQMMPTNVTGCNSMFMHIFPVFFRNMTLTDMLLLFWTCVHVSKWALTAFRLSSGHPKTNCEAPAGTPSHVLFIGFAATLPILIRHGGWHASREESRRTRNKTWTSVLSAYWNFHIQSKRAELLICNLSMSKKKARGLHNIYIYNMSCIYGNLKIFLKLMFASTFQCISFVYIEYLCKHVSKPQSGLHIYSLFS